MKLTVISGIYNEEYLLPFWLEHHRKIFDHGVIVDWHSTDRSLEIIREMCPTWEIRTTINSTFGADEIDQEFMSIEREFEGYKMVLNTTEFLISAHPIRELIADAPDSNYSIQGLGAISSDVNTYPATLQEMVNRVERVNVTRRMYRSLFSYPDGRYGLGRHYPVHPITAQIPAYVLWFGFYPWNELAIARKLQISDRIPIHDRVRGYSYHHQWNRDEQERQKEIWTSESVPCKDVEFLEDCINHLTLYAEEHKLNQ
jgi:hypothetical protein